MSKEPPESRSPVTQDYGRLRISDYVRLGYAAARVLIYETPIFILKYLANASFRQSIPFTLQLKTHIIRTVNHILTIPLLRSLISPPPVLSSPRYKSTCQNLYQLISRPTFTGYWIIQSSFTNPRPPKESDITIFYLHGGGYSISQPWTYLLFLLRIAESILAEGLSVSIFALDYHLAPEYPFPTQLNEAKAAYAYLIDEMEISPERVVVAGDSAGGHLALSFLVAMQQESERGRERKPGGLVLMSPWLSLYHYPSGNAERDVISAEFLRAAGERFLGPYEGDRSSSLIEFLDPQPSVDWNAVLPPWVWTSTGTRELMFEDIVTWTQALEQKLGRNRVEYEWGMNETHDWQWVETIDAGIAKRFLEKESECDDLEATMKIGRAIGKRMKSQEGRRLGS